MQKIFMLTSIHPAWQELTAANLIAGLEPPP